MTVSRILPPAPGELVSAVDVTRFLCKVRVDTDTGCWIWTATTAKNGYAKFSVDSEMQYAHRVSYGYFVGPIPDGMQLDHLCRNRACVNPDHLEPVTQKENILRGRSPSALNAEKTHCPAGHAYDGSTLRICKDGSRRCRACDAARKREHYRQTKTSEVIS